MTSPQYHDDPFGEAAGKVVQALAVLTTVGESAARFAAVGAQNRAAATERRANAERVADTARQHADQVAARAHAAQQRADRQLMDRAFDDPWLAAADLHTTAVLWRTAAMYAVSGDQRAVKVMRRAHNRLTQLNPGLVDAYQRHRVNGSNIAEAMRAAANETWDHQTRPAGGASADPAATFESGQPGAGALDEATRAELARLAADVDPDTLAALERQWRTAGHTPAADAASRLADAAAPRVGTPPAAQETNQVTPDTQQTPLTAGHRTNRAVAEATPPIAAAAKSGPAGDPPGRAAAPDGTHSETRDDEHRDGQENGSVPEMAGDEQRRRLGRAFRPLGTVELVFSHAPIPTPDRPAPTRRRGSTR